MAKRAMTEEAKEIKANQILDQAANWLMQMDYETIKMLDLAKSMNISNGILYVYFRTKETLFLCLLWREYNKRLSYLEAKTEESNIVCFADIKQLLLDELEYLIDCNPLYIKLECMRSVILERNTDDGILFRMKKQLSERMDAWAERLSRSGGISKQQLVEIYLMESTILTGCKLRTDIPKNVLAIIGETGMESMKRNFKRDVVFGFLCFLDGYELRMK